MKDLVRAPDFPPLLTGVAVGAGEDPLDHAVSIAETAEPGTVVYAEDNDALRLAVLLAPDRPLRDALCVAFVPLLGLNDALGALAPPEVGVHVEWPATVRVNGGEAGRLRAVAPLTDPDAEPDWLVLGLTLEIGRGPDVAAGETPDRTTLAEEGCGDIPVPDLISAWGRHMMNWLHVFMADGFAPVARGVSAIAWRVGEHVETPAPGTFLGLDETGGMILKTEDGTRSIPLSTILETP